MKYTVKPEYKVVIGEFCDWDDWKEALASLSDKKAKFCRILFGDTEALTLDDQLEVAKFLVGQRVDLHSIFFGKNNTPKYPSIIKAKAKCSDDDIWDEERGKKLVDQKIMLKRFLRICKRAKAVEKFCDDISKSMREIYDKYMSKAEAVQKDIDVYFRGKKE